MMSVDVGTYRIAFVDNDEKVTVEVRPFHLLQAEERWPGRKADLTDCMPRMAGLLFLMWVALDRPGQEREFYASIRSVEMAEADAMDPTVKEPSDA